MGKKITVTASEIKRLCTAVGTRYDEQDMSATVINLLDMSLNDMSDEDFDRLPYKMRMKLGSFAAAVRQGGLEVVDGSRAGKKNCGARQKKPQTGTMTHARRFFDRGRGAVTMEKMREVMDEAGIGYNINTLRSCILRLRREHGLVDAAKN